MFEPGQNPPPAFVDACHSARQRIRHDRKRSSSPQVVSMLAYIEEHLFDPGLSVKSCKIACGIRDNSVAMAFHSKLAVPPKEYIEQRRFETAVTLLRESDIAIWRLALWLGYKSPGIFGKMIRRRTGMAPNKYRQQLRRSKDKSSLEISTETLSQALEGRLPEKDARFLLLAFLEVYPRLRTEFSSTREAAESPEFES